MLLFSNKQTIVHRIINSSSKDKRQDNPKISGEDGIVVSYKNLNYENAGTENKNRLQRKMNSDSQGIEKTFKNHFVEKHESSDKVHEKNNGKSNSVRYWSMKKKTVAKKDSLLEYYSHLQHNLQIKKSRVTEMPYTYIRKGTNPINEGNKEININNSEGKIINNMNNSTRGSIHGRYVSKETDMFDGELDVDR